MRLHVRLHLTSFACACSYPCASPCPRAARRPCGPPPLTHSATLSSGGTRSPLWCGWCSARWVGSSGFVLSQLYGLLVQLDKRVDSCALLGLRASLLHMCSICLVPLPALCFQPSHRLGLALSRPPQPDLPCAALFHALRQHANCGWRLQAEQRPGRQQWTRRRVRCWPGGEVWGLCMAGCCLHADALACC